MSQELYCLERMGSILRSSACAQKYRVARCGIIPLRPGLGGEAEANAREDAARRDARLQPFGRAREKGVAHWPVTRSRPVVHLRERPVTG